MSVHPCIGKPHNISKVVFSMAAVTEIICLGSRVGVKVLGLGLILLGAVTSTGYNRAYYHRVIAGILYWLR